jgi:hypothetical protein
MSLSPELLYEVEHTFHYSSLKPKGPLDFIKQSLGMLMFFVQQHTPAIRDGLEKTLFTALTYYSRGQSCS